jgi:hypothetical protein
MEVGISQGAYSIRLFVSNLSTADETAIVQAVC